MFSVINAREPLTVWSTYFDLDLVAKMVKTSTGAFEYDFIISIDPLDMCSF